MVVSQFLMFTISDCLPCILCLSVVMERVPETWWGAEWEAYECIGLAVCFLARIRAYRMLKMSFTSLQKCTIVQIFEILQICKHLVLQYWGSLGIILKYYLFGFQKSSHAILQEFTTKKIGMQQSLQMFQCFN